LATAARIAAAALAALLVAAAEQAVMHPAEQTTAAALSVAALLVAARIAAGIAARVGTARRSSAARRRFTRRGSAAGRFSRTASRFATLVAATSGFARLATAVAAAVVQAQHAIQELETEALATQAYADYKRSKNHVPFHRATSPLLELRIACTLFWHNTSRSLGRFFRCGRDDKPASCFSRTLERLVGVFGVAVSGRGLGGVGTSSSHGLLRQDRSSQSLTRKVRSGCPDAPSYVPVWARDPRQVTARVSARWQTPLEQPEVFFSEWFTTTIA
jgi:hypothetical protein